MRGRDQSLLSLEVCGRNRLEDREALEDERLAKVELEVERPAGHLRNDLEAVGDELCRLLEHAAMSVRSEHPAEKRGPRDRATGLACDGGELLQKEVAPEGRLQDALPGLAQNRGGRLISSNSASRLGTGRPA